MSRSIQVFLALLVVVSSSVALQPGRSSSTFPPEVISPDVVRGLIAGKDIVGQRDLVGEYEGRHATMIVSSYEVLLPGFSGMQRVEVGSLQNDGRILHFKGPGFLYGIENGKLLRKTYVSLKPADLTVIEEGIRSAVASRRYMDRGPFFLALKKQSEEFRPPKEFIERLSDVGVSLKSYGEWNPIDHSFEEVLEAGIIPSAFTSQIRFSLKEHGELNEVTSCWSCRFEKKGGKWQKTGNGNWEHVDR